MISFARTSRNRADKMSADEVCLAVFLLLLVGSIGPVTVWLWSIN